VAVAVAWADLVIRIGLVTETVTEVAEDEAPVGVPLLPPPQPTPLNSPSVRINAAGLVRMPASFAD